MKKFLLALGLLVSCSVFADAKDVLQSRLDKVNGFYAQFTQIVKTAENQVIQEGKGELWVNRPNLFNWQINEPDSTSIISDGKDIWVYMPAVEQVTVTSLNQTIDNQLLLLITDSKSEVWNQYDVKRDQNQFTLTPHDAKQSFIITALPTGMIANFSIIEEDGQQSFYELSHQKLGEVARKNFVFTVPDGVMLDDQR